MKYEVFIQQNSYRQEIMSHRNFLFCTSNCIDFEQIPIQFKNVLMRYICMYVRALNIDNWYCVYRLLILNGIEVIQSSRDS